MLKVFAAYYKQIGGGRSFLKFFETRQDAERMYQYEFGFLGGIKCSVFRNKCLFLNKKRNNN